MKLKGYPLTPTIATLSMVFLKPAAWFLAYLDIVVGLIDENVLTVAAIVTAFDVWPCKQVMSVWLSSRGRRCPSIYTIQTQSVLVGRPLILVSFSDENLGHRMSIYPKVVCPTRNFKCPVIRSEIIQARASFNTVIAMRVTPSMLSDDLRGHWKINRLEDP